MTALTRVTFGENPVRSSSINQIIDAWNGNTAGVNQGNSPLALTAINDPINYAFAVRNADTAGKGLIVYAPDGVTPLLRVDKTNGVFASPDGVVAAAPILTTTGTQTLTNKTLTAPHMTGAVVDSGGLSITAGNLGIGTVPGANVGLYVNETINAANGIATGFLQQGSLVAQVNSDVLAGLSLQPTFNPNAKTGVVATAIDIAAVTGANANNYGLRIATPSGAGGDNVPMRITGVGTGAWFRVDNTTVTTVGAAGGATALPAAPSEYALISVNGNLRKFPLYAP